MRHRMLKEEKNSCYLYDYIQHTCHFASTEFIKNVDVILSIESLRSIKLDKVYTEIVKNLLKMLTLM